MTEYQLRISYGAPAYQDQPEGQARKAELEKEFGLTGHEASVGTGAEGPGIAFLVDIADLIKTYGGYALFVLVKGKDITEAITFYIEVGKRLARYVKGHYTYLEWNGAYALAVKAIVEHLGVLPKSLVLEGYGLGDPSGGGWDHEVELTEIGELPRHAGAFLPHHFQFKVNGGARLKAIVNPNGVLIVELPPKKAA